MRMRRSRTTNETMSTWWDGSSTGAIGGSRTFTYLGPGTASLNVRMGGRWRNPSQPPHKW